MESGYEKIGESEIRFDGSSGFQKASWILLTVFDSNGQTITYRAIFIRSTPRVTLRLTDIFVTATDTFAPLLWLRGICLLICLSENI